MREHWYDNPELCHYYRKLIDKKFKKQECEKNVNEAQVETVEACAK